MKLLAYRLANQQLAQQRFTCPSEVVAWFGGVQAQDYTAAKWAIGQRLPSSTDSEVEKAFADGAILRTHVMRPTWHFVSPADIRWMLALTAPRVNALSAYYYRQHDLDPAFFARSEKAMVKALEGGREHTRQEIAVVLERAGLLKHDAPGVAQRMGQIMLRAELDGVVCSGARRGKQFTYALLDERAPHAKTRSRREALAELATRYFTSHGPATLRDFAWWSGLSGKDALTGLEIVQSKLHSVVSGGQTYWMPSPISAVQNSGRKAYLLPNFDEYIVAYADRGSICDAARGNLLFNHTIVLDGKIAGTWKRSLTKTHVTIEMKLFTAINKVEGRKIAAAAKRYGAFLGHETTVSIV